MTEIIRNIEVQKGADVSIPFVALYEVGGTPIDLTGKTISATMRRASFSYTDYEFTINITDAANGEFSIEMTESYVNEIPSSRCFYEINLFDTETVKIYGGIAIVLDEGQIAVTPPNTGSNQQNTFKDVLSGYSVNWEDNLLIDASLGGFELIVPDSPAKGFKFDFVDKEDTISGANPVTLKNSTTTIETITVSGYYIIVWTGTSWVSYRGFKSSDISPVFSVNGKIGDVVLDKIDVGLSNVDNTPDISKPVSTAQAAADIAVLSSAQNYATLADSVVLSSAQSYADSKVIDSIADADTTHAPSRNAVFDALALKQNSLGYTPENVTNKQSDLTASATKYPTVDAVNDGLATKEPNIASGTVGEYYRGDKTFQPLNKAAVGLGNVDNTSDISKPVSTAQASADSAVLSSAQSYADGKVIDSIADADTTHAPSRNAVFDALAGKMDVGSVTQYTDEMAQDAIGAMVNSTLVYTDATPSLSRAALTGAITAPVGSNTTSLGSFTTAQLNTALSDNDIATGGGVITGTSSGTNTGDQTTIVGISGTKTQFNAAVTDGDILFVGDVTQYTDEQAQDAIGAMIDSTLSYVDSTPLLSRAALTGAITAPQGSNTTSLGSFTTAQLNTALSDNDIATGGGVITGTSTGTNTGDQTSIVGISGTKSQFNSAVTDGDILYVGDITQYTDEQAQDAIGAMIDSSLIYVDGTPLLSRAALTGAITAPQGSNTTSLGSFTTAQLNAALSDNDIATGGGVITGTSTGTNTGDQTSIVGITGTLSQFNAAITDADILSTANAAATYQPLDAQLSSLSNLSFTGNTLKVVRVNAGETDFELVTFAGGGDVTGDDISTTIQNIVAYSDTGGKNITELTGTQGDILYHNGTSWAKLPAGVAGKHLMTNGAGQNPSWSSTVTITDVDFGGFGTNKSISIADSTITSSDLVICSIVDGTTMTAEDAAIQGIVTTVSINSGIGYTIHCSAPNGATGLIKVKTTVMRV